ncbi:MAG: hypothetical protein WBX25_34545 [Rhodomicrobium sp.]
MDYRKEFIVVPSVQIRLTKIMPPYSGKRASYEKAAPELRRHHKFHKQAGPSKSGRRHG